MRPGMKGLRGIGLLTGSVMTFAVSVTSAYPQEAITTESMISQLAGLEANSDVDVVALRQRVLDRVKSKVDAASLKRPPVAAELLKRGDKRIQQFVVGHSSRALSAPGTSSVMTCTYVPTNSDKADERRVTAR